MPASSSPSSPLKLILLVVIVVVAAIAPLAQSRGTGGGARRSVTLNVIARAPAGKQISKDDFDLYDANVLQEVENFGKLDVGSRIVLLVDGSSSLRVDPAALQKAAREVVDELYSDDQMMVVCYNEEPNVVEEMTPDLTLLQATPAKLTRKGSPNLFDALIAVADSFNQQAKTGVEKRAIILISDGYDSESKTKFDDALNELLEGNIVFYAIQVQDRTRGALIRDKPKPPSVLNQLAQGTGGAIFPVAGSADAAKAIAEDLRNNWYRLVYTPSGVETINSRRILLMCRTPGLQLRTKASHPARRRP